MNTPFRAATLTFVITAASLAAGIAPSAAVPETELKPAQIERGDDIRIPHVEGSTIVDGDLRVRVQARTVRLLGKSGADYVVGAANRVGERQRTLRVTAAGDQQVLFRDRDIWEQQLSPDGAQIVVAGRRTAERSTIQIRDAVTGAVVASHRFRGYRDVLDFADGQVVLGRYGPSSTTLWDVAGQEFRQVAGRAGYAADIRRDRLGSYTRDPYRGGCSVVSTLSQPREQLWRSCSERVDSFAPSGRRMTTIPILSDGLGPNQVRLRTVSGRVLARYTAEWFGLIWWESQRDVLLQTNGRHQAAVVRCRLRDCERASDLEPVQTP